MNDKGRRVLQRARKAHRTDTAFLNDPMQSGELRTRRMRAVVDRLEQGERLGTVDRIVQQSRLRLGERAQCFLTKPSWKNTQKVSTGPPPSIVKE